MRYLTLEEILKAHEILLERYGGRAGIRDQGLLEAALYRPRVSAYGKDAYPSVYDKAAAICHSLLFNHPFIDGNKRTAFAACHLTLLLNGRNLTPTSEKIYSFLSKVLSRHLDWTAISAWLKKNSQPLP